jgi:hypothetical protein
MSIDQGSSTAPVTAVAHRSRNNQRYDDDSCSTNHDDTRSAAALPSNAKRETAAAHPIAPLTIYHSPPNRPVPSSFLFPDIAGAGTATPDAAALAHIAPGFVDPFHFDWPHW